MAEADLVKLKQTYDFVLKGTRLSEIALQEAALKSSIEQNKLENLCSGRARASRPISRSSKPRSPSRGWSGRRSGCALLKTTLENDLAQIRDRPRQHPVPARQRQAHHSRTRWCVRRWTASWSRSFSRQGERVSPTGLVKIVDMNQLRVLADVDELHVGRLEPGGKVDVTFRGNNDVYKGTIERIAPTVKRMQRVEPDGGSSTDARVVQVEIKIDDSSSMPPVLGRETRVTFL